MIAPGGSGALVVRRTTDFHTTTDELRILRRGRALAAGRLARAARPYATDIPPAATANATDRARVVLPSASQLLVTRLR